jgi:hypothetical protein
MRGDSGCQPVQITEGALTRLPSLAQHDADSLSQYIEIFTQIAEKKIEARAFAFDGRIWITESDVHAWRHFGWEAKSADQGLL